MIRYKYYDTMPSNAYIRNNDPISLSKYFMEKLEGKQSSIYNIANILKELQAESNKLQEDINKLVVNRLSDQLRKDTLYWIQKTYNSYEFDRIYSIILRTILMKATAIENKCLKGLKVSDKDIKFAKLITSMNINSNEQLMGVLDIIVEHCGCNMTIPIKKYFKIYSTQNR